MSFQTQNYLTEINHKVSVTASPLSVICRRLRGEMREAAMRDASVGAWTSEPALSGELLKSVRELNHLFLDLVAGGAGDWNVSRSVGLPEELSRQVAPLSPAQKAAAASCPYALFDVRFDDEAYWESRLQNTGHWQVADETFGDPQVSGFARLALFFAWHVASAGDLAARLLLGMNGSTVRAFRTTTMDCLPTLVASEVCHLTARWNDRSIYWRSLVRAAARPNAPQLRRVQLYGLQLAAASQLSKRGLDARPGC